MVEKTRILLPLLSSSMQGNTAGSEKFKDLHKDCNLLEAFLQAWNAVLEQLVASSDASRISSLDVEHRTKLLDNLEIVIKSKEIKNLRSLPQVEVFFDFNNFQLARQALLKFYEQNMASAHEALQEELPDFALIAGHVDSAQQHEQSEILQKVFAKLRREGFNMLELAKNSENSNLEDEDLKSLQILLRKFKDLQQSSLFPKFSEAHQHILTVFINESKEEFKKCKEKVSQLLGSQAYTGECVRCLYVLKRVSKIYPEFFKDSKACFETHLIEIIQNPNIELSVAVVKKLINHSPSHAVSQLCRKTFESDWDHFVELFADKLKHYIDEKQRSIEDHLSKENVAATGPFFKSIDVLISDPSVCQLCQQEKKKHLDLNARRTSMLQHHSKMVSDFLEENDFNSAAHLLANMSMEKRPEIYVLFRQYANKLKKKLDEEIPLPPKEGRNVFINSGNFLASLISIENEVENDKNFQNLIRILQEIVRCLEGIFWKDLQDAYTSISGDLKSGIEQHEMRFELTRLADFKRLILLPTDKMSQSVNINQTVRKTVDTIVDFIRRSQQFLDIQMQHIQGDNQQLDTKGLRRAVLNVYANRAVLVQMEEILKKAAEREQLHIPAPWGRYMKQFEDLFFVAINKKKEVVVHAANDGFFDAVMYQAFATLSLLSTELGDELNVARTFEECQKHIASCLHDTAKQAVSYWEIQDLDKLNSELDKLDRASEGFKSCPSQDVKLVVSNEMQVARKPIMEELQKMRRDAYAVEDGAGPGMVCEKLNKIRALAGKIPHILHAVIARIGEVLQQIVQCENSEFVGELGQSMLVSEWGKYSVSEQPLLKHIKAIGYMTKIPPLTPSAAVSQMNGAPKVDSKKLVVFIERYDYIFKTFVGEFIRNTDASYDVRKTRLCNIIKCYSIKADRDGLELIALVCTLVALIKSGETYGRSKGSVHLMAPHTIQVACLIRLMGIDSGQPSIFDHSASALSKKSKAKSSKKISNHVMQIPTGEGKSIVLGVIACIFALQGLVVDCVCYSKYLSKRDYDDFSEVFVALGVEGGIRYFTFQELCEKHIHGVRESVLNLIRDEGTNGHNLHVDVNAVSRVLLIDEVDVFFKRQFYGSTLNAGTLLQSDTIERLIRLIWTQKARGLSLDWVLKSAEYVAVTAEFEPIKAIIDIAVVGMLDGVKTFGTPRYEVRGSKLGYVINSCFQSDVSFPYRTIFAYLHEHDTNPSCITSDMVKQRIGIEIRCGQYSYAAIPPKYYGSIFGVTGTLTTLPEHDKLVLEKEFDVTAHTIAASVYGETQLDFNPKEANHVMVEENVANWRRKIADLVKREADNKRAVLVCFKNDLELREYAKSYPSYSTQSLTSIEEETDLFSIQGKVLNATMPRKVTLMTRKYGRGVDFGCSSKSVLGAGGVMIIQTFYSSTLSEESQIKGRVARQGEPGSYRQVLCAEHFQKKFGKLISGSMTKEELLKTLLECRESRTQAKLLERNERKLVADQKDANAMLLIEALYGNAISKSTKLEQLMKNALGSTKRNFIVIIDVSGSMNCSWPSLCAAYNRFLKALKQNQGDLDNSIVSLVYFDDIAATKIFTLSEAKNLSGPMPKTGGNQSTNFSAAFEQCKHLVQNEADPTRFCNIVFMTDGEGGNPSVVVEKMLQAHARRIIRYDCIAFGSEAQNAEVLGKVEVQFQQAGVLTQMMNSDNANELSEAFATCAGPDMLHMK